MKNVVFWWMLKMLNYCFAIHITLIFVEGKERKSNCELR